MRKLAQHTSFGLMERYLASARKIHVHRGLSDLPADLAMVTENVSLTKHSHPVCYLDMAGIQKSLFSILHFLLLRLLGIVLVASYKDC